ncbi:MAG: peptidoglycan-binding protein [Colwellia sp.]|nr:peptidoglycan-binding protein [Colwellia sp.]
MIKHKVKQGDCLASIAKQYGFHEPEIIYSNASNSALKSKRKNLHILKKGDVVKIPDKENKQESITDGKKHSFVAKGLITEFKLLLENFDGTALANKEYLLAIEGALHEGTTTEAGLVAHKIDASATGGKITVWLDSEKIQSITWLLNIGFLDPLDENSGVQARLNNLGYDCGEIDGKIDNKSKLAIKAFKTNNGLNKDDVVDDITKKKLKEVYGI